MHWKQERLAGDRDMCTIAGFCGTRGWDVAPRAWP